jgi:UDP-GlcNAc:undecaprenyl-phosphate GlcNAc-1-phosphate transferase
MTIYIFYILSSFLLIFFFYKSNTISKFLGLYKKAHDKTPIMGGLGIYFFFIVGIIFLYFSNPQIIEKNLSIIFLMSSIFLIGLMDDIYNLSYKVRLITIFIVLFIFFKYENRFVVNQLFFETINQTYVLGNLKYFLTPLFIMLLLNSMNMADGINGNSSLIFLSYFFILFEKNNNLNLFLPLIIISLLIFLFFNFKNKSYIGDSGIYFISIFVSLYVLNNYNHVDQNLSCEKIFLTFIIPGIDMFRLFCVRIYNKKNPFKGDLNHLHHLLHKKFNLALSLIIYMFLILWPFVFIKYYKVDYAILISISILLYTILFNFLKSQKKLSNK